MQHCQTTVDHDDAQDPHGLAALHTALARDHAAQAQAERAQAFQRALACVGEALL